MTKIRGRLENEAKKRLESFATPGSSERASALRQAHRYTSPKDPAITEADIVSEATIAALEGTDPSASAQYLRRIIDQKGINHLRSTRVRSRRAGDSLDRPNQDGNTLARRLPSDEDNPLDIVVESATRQEMHSGLEAILQEAIASGLINPRDVELLLKAYVKKEKTTDIASEVGLTPSGVKVALMRARHKLRNYEPMQRLRATLDE